MYVFSNSIILFKYNLLQILIYRIRYDLLRYSEQDVEGIDFSPLSFVS